MSELRIACVGDIMCGDSFYALGHGVASVLDRYGKDFLPNNIVDVLRGHDMVLCNVECVLSDIGRKENSLRRLHMRGRPQAAEYLGQWGITLAHVANNHILEQGVDAAVDTLSQLQSARIKTVGAGKNGCFQVGIEPVALNLCGESVAVVGACFHNGKYAFSSKLNEVLESIRTEAGKENLVIVSVHWGDELIDRPSMWQRLIARKFINAGASLILGHHPHVVQGVDSSDSALIAYSLGNFIFDSHLESTDWSMILSITISEKKVSKWEAIPVLRDKDHRPELARGVRKDELQKEVLRRCSLSGQEIVDANKYEQEYISELRNLGAKSRHRLWGYIAKRFTCYRTIYWPQFLFRFIQRRTGLW
jgi:poly-gamma-glutamate synthesis protein (capsule biosynthesis protein)